VRRKGLAMIAAVDDGVGQVRQLLRERGWEKDTLIFFVSDNGAPTKPGMWDGSLNEPFVGEKGMLTDGGVRLPFLACWPGTLPAGRVYEPAVISLDIMATALGAAGVEPRAELKLDGVNLLPFLTGRQGGSPHEALFWRFSSQAAVLADRWKLLFVAPDQWLLFDHNDAAGETRDVAAQHPDVVARLRRRLEAWCAEQSPAGLPTQLHPPDAEFMRRHRVGRAIAEKR
jgi:arylsulfatase A-like enzyme